MPSTNITNSAWSTDHRLLLVWGSSRLILVVVVVVVVVICDFNCGTMIHVR